MAKRKVISDEKVTMILGFIKLPENKDKSDKEIAEIWQISPNSAGDIRKAGTLEGWIAAKEKKAEQQRERVEKRKAENEKKEEEQVPGQIRMDIIPAEKPEMSDQTKMMRFQAGQYDEIRKRISSISAVFAETSERIGEVFSGVMTECADLIVNKLDKILQAVRKE